MAPEPLKSSQFTAPLAILEFIAVHECLEINCIVIDQNRKTGKNAIDCPLYDQTKRKCALAAFGGVNRLQVLEERLEAYRKLEWIKNLS